MQNLQKHALQKNFRPPTKQAGITFMVIMIIVSAVLTACRDSAQPLMQPAVDPSFVTAVSAQDAALQERLFKAVKVTAPTQSYLAYNKINPSPDGKHSGVDYPGSYTVYSPVDGIVRAAGGDCGSVVIEDSRPLSTWPGAKYAPRHVFLHMKDIRVTSGHRVTTGSEIGTSSNAARGNCTATGVHLHYEIRRDYTGTGGVYKTSCGSVSGCTTASLTYNPYTFPFPAGTTPTPPPSQRREIVVDDMSGGFTRSGTASFWKQASIGWAGHVFYTLSDQSRIDNQGTWRPGLTSVVRGEYTVAVFVPRNYATTRNATYSIYHDGRTDTRSVNQMAYSDQWVSLGRFYFRGDGTEYVRLVDRTGESNTQRTMVAFDAVKFTP